MYYDFHTVMKFRGGGVIVPTAPSYPLDPYLVKCWFISLGIRWTVPSEFQFGLTILLEIMGKNYFSTCCGVFPKLSALWGLKMGGTSRRHKQIRNIFQLKTFSIDYWFEQFIAPRLYLTSDRLSINLSSHIFIVFRHYRWIH